MEVEGLWHQPHDQMSLLDAMNAAICGQMQYSWLGFLPVYIQILAFWNNFEK